VVLREHLAEERLEAVVVRRLHCVAAHARVFVLYAGPHDREERRTLAVRHALVVSLVKVLDGKIVRVRLLDGGDLGKSSLVKDLDTQDVRESRSCCICIATMLHAKHVSDAKDVEFLFAQNASNTPCGCISAPIVGNAQKVSDADDAEVSCAWLGLGDRDSGGQTSRCKAGGGKGCTSAERG